jgi:hypothetical protein
MIDKVKILDTKVLSDNWYVLRKITYEYLKKDGTKQTQTREAYDRGNGATILLYNKEQKTVILTRQFRLPTFVNGNERRNAHSKHVQVCWIKTMQKIASNAKRKKKQAIKYLM